MIRPTILKGPQDIWWGSRSDDVLVYPSVSIRPWLLSNTEIKVFPGSGAISCLSSPKYTRFKGSIKILCAAEKTGQEKDGSLMVAGSALIGERCR